MGGWSNDNRDTIFWDGSITAKDIVKSKNMIISGDNTLPTGYNVNSISSPRLYIKGSGQNGQPGIRIDNTQTGNWFIYTGSAFTNSLAFFTATTNQDILVLNTTGANFNFGIFGYGISDDMKSTGLCEIGDIGGFYGIPARITVDANVGYIGIDTPDLVINSLSGYSGTITTAKLTAIGSNGSMTFTNGILTSQTQAT